MSAATDIKTGTIDFTQAEAYLETLSGPNWRNEVFTYQSIDDNKDRQRAMKEAHGSNKPKSALNRTISGTFESRKPWIETMSAQGCGIFVTVNRTDGTGRKAENIREIRAFWCEWDGPGNPPEWPLEPHMVVGSSPGKFHFYWLVDGLQTHSFGRVMKIMVAMGSDPNAKDICRVMRIPGTWHRKVDAEKGLVGTPWQVTLINAEDRPAYSLEEVFAAFATFEPAVDLGGKKGGEERPKKPKRSDYNKAEIRSALAAIRGYDERDIWLTIGMALHSTRLPDARDWWDGWSGQSSKYDPAGQQTAWESFRDKEGGVGIGTLYQMAMADGWKRENEAAARLLVNQFGQPISCAANAKIWLKQSGLDFGFDTLAKCPCIGGEAIDDDREIALLIDLQEQTRIPITREHFDMGLANVCASKPFHPVADWLKSLQWDGKKRADQLFKVCFGAEDSPYMRGASRYLMVSSVMRALTPGCQVDCMAVLEGVQGARKSSAIIALFGSAWHCEVAASLSDKDFFQNLRGKWCVEFGEMTGISKADSNEIKRILTNKNDTYRASYARKATDNPRQNIFIGTTNDDAYLRDPTGDRRYLPIKTGAIRLDWLESDRLQLWAEAYRMVQDGPGEWWIVPGAAEQQERRFMADPWETEIRFAVEGRTLTTVEALLNAPLGIPIKDWHQGQKQRIAAILKRLGWACKPEWYEGRTQRIYRPCQD